MNQLKDLIWFLLEIESWIDGLVTHFGVQSLYPMVPVSYLSSIYMQSIQALCVSALNDHLEPLYSKIRYLQLGIALHSYVKLEKMGILFFLFIYFFS